MFAMTHTNFWNINSLFWFKICLFMLILCYLEWLYFIYNIERFINFLECSCSSFFIGADVNLKNDGGRTALHYAASKGRMKIAEILISHDAKLNIKDKVVAWILFIYFWHYAFKCPPFFIITLLKMTL